MVPKVFLPYFGIGSFLDGDMARDFIYFFFSGMRFSGVTLDLVTPVKTELVSPVSLDKTYI